MSKIRQRSTQDGLPSSAAPDRAYGAVVPSAHLDEIGHESPARSGADACRSESSATIGRNHAKTWSRLCPPDAILVKTRIPLVKGLVGVVPGPDHLNVVARNRGIKMNERL